MERHLSFVTGFVELRQERLQGREVDEVQGHLQFLGYIGR